jgi:hypothetical protein
LGANALKNQYPEPCIACAIGVGMRCAINEKEVVGLSELLGLSILAKIFRDLTKFQPVKV